MKSFEQYLLEVFGLSPTTSQFTLHVEAGKPMTIVAEVIAPSGNPQDLKLLMKKFIMQTTDYVETSVALPAFRNIDCPISEKARWPF